ncbi:MAG: hypothetical protein P8N60_14705 [Burkholderiaceae bacterium]|nr:hypothetical protein [Burkholderiaceae bacterium]
MTHLQVIIDAMLPADPELGMPYASSIDFEAYLELHEIVGVADEFVRMLDKVCGDKFSLPFIDLLPEQKMQAINACKLVDVRGFSALVGHLLRAYYTSPLVLSKIGAGSIPPFPQGNSLPQDDWSILEPVYERGQVYREIQED